MAKAVHVCQECNKKFKTNNDFNNHSCVQEASKLSFIDLLDKLYKSGGCSKAYYETSLVAGKFQ